MSVQIVDLTAHRNDEPGPDKDEAQLHVNAILRFTTEGWRHGEVNVVNPGINPAMLRLEIDVTKPAGDVGQRMDGQPISWMGPAGQITEVSVQVVGDARDSSTVRVTSAS